MGLRNPFTMSVSRRTGRVFVNDVGSGYWEEINDITLPGLYLGWPTYGEGPTGNADSLTHPVFTYRNNYSWREYPVNEKGCAVTGGTFFEPGSTNYPASFQNKYFFLDYCNRWIKYIDYNSGVIEPVTFATDLIYLNLSLKEGLDGNLYYLVFEAGILHKIIYSDQQSPAILKTSSAAHRFVDQTLRLKAFASGNPDLAYQWQKDGIDIAGADSSVLLFDKIALTDAGNR